MSPTTVQRAAVGLISAGMRDFRNASHAILRDCDSLQALIALYATGKTNSSIVQELINVGVGTGSLQSSLSSVLKNLNSTLTAQSTSSTIPSDCITTGNQLDDMDVSPTDSRFTAWYQKCSQYMTQWAMKDAADWDDDWARNSNVRTVVGVWSDMRSLSPLTASAEPAEQHQHHQRGAQLQPARLGRRLGQGRPV